MMRSHLAYKSHPLFHTHTHTHSLTLTHAHSLTLTHVIKVLISPQWPPHCCAILNSCNRLLMKSKPPPFSNGNFPRLSRRCVVCNVWCTVVLWSSCLVCDVLWCIAKLVFEVSISGVYRFNSTPHPPPTHRSHFTECLISSRGEITISAPFVALKMPLR